MTALTLRYATKSSERFDLSALTPERLASSLRYTLELRRASAQAVLAEEELRPYFALPRVLDGLFRYAAARFAGGFY